MCELAGTLRRQISPASGRKMKLKCEFLKTSFLFFFSPSHYYDDADVEQVDLQRNKTRVNSAKTLTIMKKKFVPKV